MNHVIMSHPVHFAPSFLMRACSESSSKQKFSSFRSWLIYWLVVSTPLKNISQNGNLPQEGMKIKNIWNHHLVWFWSSFCWVLDQGSNWSKERTHLRGTKSCGNYWRHIKYQRNIKFIPSYYLYQGSSYDSNPCAFWGGNREILGNGPPVIPPKWDPFNDPWL